MTSVSTRSVRKPPSRHFDVVGSCPMATRLDRLKAGLIDGVCLLAAFIPFSLILYLLGAWDYFWGAWALSAGGAAAIFLLLNFSLLKTEGQTIGKRIMKIRMIGRDDQPLGIQALLLKRYAVFGLIAFVPVLGPVVCLANVLLIFRISHSCGHDELAGSKVVPA